MTTYDIVHFLNNVFALTVHFALDYRFHNKILLYSAITLTVPSMFSIMRLYDGKQYMTTCFIWHFSSVYKLYHMRSLGKVIAL